MKCSPSVHAPHGTETDPPIPVSDKDPVCGMTVKPDSPHQAVHAGHTFRFCSEKCLAKFTAEPQRYLTPTPEAIEVAPTGTEYTCPMHPEVRQIGPGTCPKPDAVSYTHLTLPTSDLV